LINFDAVMSRSGGFHGHSSSVVRATVAALAVSLTLVAVWAQPAVAAPWIQVIVSDSFETPANWTGYHGPQGEAYVSNNPPAARSGQWAGFLAQSGTLDWASLERVFMSPAGKSCSASIWVRATSTTYGHIKFNVEVIEPASFTYVALKQVEFNNNNVPFGYAQYTTPGWRSTSARALLFRVSLFGAAGPFADAAFLDDLSVVCI
jgi:hypothetical protein